MRHSRTAKLENFSYKLLKRYMIACSNVPIFEICKNVLLYRKAYTNSSFTDCLPKSIRRKPEKFWTQK